MTPENFCYWLQGFFELTGRADGPKAIDSDQARSIKQHLELVFKKVTEPVLTGPRVEDLLRDWKPPAGQTLQPPLVGAPSPFPRGMEIYCSAGGVRERAECSQPSPEAKENL